MKIGMVIFLVLVSLAVRAQDLKHIQNESYIIKQHSFKVYFKNVGHVKFISYYNIKNSPPKVDFFLVNNVNHILYTLPTYYGNEHWAFYSVKAVSFKDINDDGLKDILIIADYITGIGPSGTEPFDVAGFYIQDEKGFKRYKALEERVNSEALYGKWKSIRDLVAIASAYQKSQAQ